MNRRLGTVLASLTVSVLVVASCSVGPAYRTPKPDVPDRFVASTQAAPGAAVGAGVSPTVPDLASWWKSLNDPELDSLVDRAVKNNFDIEVALVRLQQARTYEAEVVGHALPEVDATGAEARGTGTDLSRGRATQPRLTATDGLGSGVDS